MILDGIIVMVISAFGAVGYYRGFLKTIMSFASSFVAIIFAFIIQPIISSFLKLTPLYPIIYKWIGGRVEKVNFGVGVQTQGEAIRKSVTWLPDFISDSIVKNNNAEVYKLLKVSTIKEYVSESLTQVVLGILAILFAWLIIKAIFILLLASTDAVIKVIPIVSKLNRLSGFGIGVVKGVLGIWIVGLLLSVVLTSPHSSAIATLIQESSLTKWLYENNLILQAFSNMVNK
ncbi:hypothetical protein CS063_16605 [Sporanaerobium hydrogeniformans]|uniref:Uncharacterized protein n=1 Tax=Sporanaerobium hydrogeniformans TaxID=3072179 RepID=A0AC61D8W5_9FIRM|nr:CvpA family protein [Sporanaerobium hydrogeniformans]PHV69275.1 hypothetical protein CS063_16605 [Sporanaerobium hydrogeniformans]